MNIIIKPKCKKNGERTNNYKYFVYTAKIVKITNLFVSTVARNSGNCNLIVHVGCYDYINIYNYNPITTILVLSIRHTKTQNNNYFNYIVLGSKPSLCI